MTIGWPLPRVLAHRCGGRLAPENTLAGLNAAAALGCRGVEFDVMLSADGIPVLIHDETLERTTDGSGPVAETTYGALACLDAGSRFCARFAGEPVPRLDAALARCAALGLAVNLELKPSTGCEAETGTVVGRALTANWATFAPHLVLSSFSERALVAAADAAPGFLRALLVERVPADWRDRCAALGAVALHVSCEGLDPGDVTAIRAAGLHIAIYTENSPARAAPWLALGVDTVVTDHPERFLAPPFVQ
ncbi:glycerophosphodiester phosphodiesterase [Azoarcus olearius]|uniref:Probable glycerophosphodiester phosphodiesterase n=1 Tax=Azoarcus sp. (strain BH72) TaxID=418699 RepID=A1K475_AZOSB|nr:glycerophosphodiester phosphodiesterase [Azoarcus olearius]CAL93630.1 probable glycerophosphodiester phosphodiesterase [Azoarcus olearius]